ncbi:MAG: ribonuclease [Geminicoccaceae bacterium]
MPRLLVFLVVGLALPTMPALAFEPRSGCIVAEQACEAPISTRRSDNPGDIRLEIGRAYLLLGANKAEASHLQIVVPGAKPEQRWIDVGCGRATGICDSGGGQPTPRQPAEHSHSENMLAVSWQPAFCETQRRKPECMAQSLRRFDATNFTLHGLWPQPRSREYCDVDAELVRIDGSGRWDQLPRLDLEAVTRDALAQAMPGVRSRLDRHEWIRHGSCYSRTADEYFQDSLLLLDELNASSVRALVASRIGRSLTLGQLRSAFDSAFGTGAGDRVAMECDPVDGRRLVTGLRLNLSGEVTPQSSLAELLAAAPSVKGGCREGIVDPAGVDE